MRLSGKNRSIKAKNSIYLFSILNNEAGNQATFAGDICSAFQVNTPIQVLALGAFNNNGNSIGNLTLQLSLGTTTPVNESPLISLTLTFGASNNQVSGGYEYVSLSTPVTLNTGIYLVCGTGFNANAMNGNTNMGFTPSFSASDIVENTAGGAITFAGSYYSTIGGTPINGFPALFAAASLIFQIL